MSLQCLGVIIFILLAVFRGGLQISSSRIGRPRVKNSSFRITIRWSIVEVPLFPLFDIL